MYKFNKLLPFNIRIPVRIREHILYLYISQLGYVTLEVETFLKGRLIKYKRNKIKIHLKFKNDRRTYVMAIHNKVPLEYRNNVKFVGRIYYKINEIRHYLDNLFIYKYEYERALIPPPPRYEEICYSYNV